MEKILSFIKNHYGKITGAVTGFILAVLILLIGLFRVLFLIFCTAIGYYTGKKISEDKDYIRNLLDKILPPGTYR